MNDYENDGRDYGEIIDEGPTNVETEGFFSSSKPDSKKQDSNKQEQKKKESKKQQPEKSSTLSSSGRCTCKPASEPKQRRRNKKMKKEKELKVSTGGGKRGRKKKERRLTNPFIIFYLEMYSKNRTLCVAEVAQKAGKIWKNMSAKEKEEYVNKARRSQSTRMLAKNKKKGKKTE
ncbi:high mobility group protein B3-like [Chelonus insularis]|uniref:high mobility group protein B3-like n=1 Tax=Chelonus insularis TaxID=460826 RepID=UPI00158BF7CC|nr:high mobility group protein B3-like [Chelonus insularis]